MNDVRPMFPRSVAPPVGEANAPEGVGGAQTHWERLMWQARDRFAEGEWSKGLENLGHAAYVGVTKHEDVDPHVALTMLRAVLGVAWTPEDAA